MSNAYVDSWGMRIAEHLFRCVSSKVMLILWFGHAKQQCKLKSELTAGQLRSLVRQHLLQQENRNTFDIFIANVYIQHFKITDTFLELKKYFWAKSHVFQISS